MGKTVVSYVDDLHKNVPEHAAAWVFTQRYDDAGSIVEEITQKLPALSDREAGKNEETAFFWWRLEGTLLRIGGQSAPPDRWSAVFPSYPRRNWYGIEKTVTEVVIENGVRYLDQNSFEGWENLSRVTLPESIQWIGSDAFRETGLESIVLPEGLTRIGMSLFQGCKQLTEVTIPDSVEEIGYCAFAGCTALSRITLPKGIKKIGGAAFSGAGIRELDLPEGLLAIGAGAFSGMPLTEMRIPDSVTDVWGRLFYGPPSFPVQLPKGREDMPAFEAQTAEEYLHHFAYIFFRGRSDVLVDSSGDPVEDRFLAMQRIFQFVQEHFFEDTPLIRILQNSEYSHDSNGAGGELSYEYSSDTVSVYDGGCYGTDVISHYLCVRLISEEELRQAREKKAFDPGRGNHFDLIRECGRRFPALAASENAFIQQADSRCEGLYLEHPFGGAFHLRIFQRSD